MQLKLTRFIRSTNCNWVYYLNIRLILLLILQSQGRDKNRDGFLIRRTSIETGVNCFTSLDTVDALLTSLESDAKNDLSLVDIATIE